VSRLAGCLLGYVGWLVLLLVCYWVGRLFGAVGWPFVRCKVPSFNCLLGQIVCL